MARLLVDMAIKVIKGGSLCWSTDLGVYAHFVAPDRLSRSVYTARLLRGVASKTVVVVGRKAGSTETSRFRRCDQFELWKSYADCDVSSFRFLPHPLRG